MDNFYSSYNSDKGFMSFDNSFIEQASCPEEKKKIYKGKVK